jgi:RNA polymerase II subunit A small phosphatase-like protein
MPSSVFHPPQTLADDNSQSSILIGPQHKRDRGLKTLVLDLDETLVHSSFKPVENADITLPIEIDGQVCTIYVLVRPHVAEFLKRMAKIYELVVFTASLSKYAEPLMLKLDPNNYCGYKLFREHCTFYNNAFVKDLTRLGRPMKDVIILDNSPVAYLF